MRMIRTTAGKLIPPEAIATYAKSQTCKDHVRLIAADGTELGLVRGQLHQIFGRLQRGEREGPTFGKKTARR